MNCEDMVNPIFEKIHPGDVVLTSGARFELGFLPIKVANFFKRGYVLRGWTHAALYIGNNEVIEAFPAGIVRRNFEESYLRGSHNLLILRRRKASQDDLNKVVDFCVFAKGKKYDYRALIYFLLYDFLPAGLHFLLEKNYVGNCFNVNDSYFCSELVSAGFQEADIYAFEREPYKVMPIDFYNDFLFNVVHKIELPKKENRFISLLKGTIFRFLYIMTAILFPVIIILFGALIIGFVSLVIYGAIGLVVFIFSMPRLAKKKHNNESLITDNKKETGKD